MNYYSARLLVVCIVNDGESSNNHTCDYPIIVFRAKNEMEAFEKAIELGRNQETIYKNEEGQEVRWVLAAVEEVWSLGKEIDGVEVGSIMDVWESEEKINYHHKFNPEKELPVFSNNET